ncbi:EF-P beta-lysylation protein EpmB [Lysobacter sp. HDW10]|uniref:EF-P beta-lysylation protein EpmB n=1 Tax=Lysobacter sp. HDW10 TaxID=2714936 RepID=UPI00140B7387|nr:EF-P beta-lysylation protein EpmB [Lysobacter sp. HDW10]QIK81862.1 EF-P beta-lysylation protein EpmB [Lysobacter sp. HDW10]
MIPAALPAQKSEPSWQAAWRNAVTDPYDLLSRLNLGHLSATVSAEARAQFPLRVPEAFVARMVSGDPHDPLLRQVLPLDAECLDVPGFSFDAVGDGKALAAHGVLHKYAGRVLLVTTGSCAIHCRYCFRRHFPYADETASINDWDAAVAYIAYDSSITEVILSGGDPLSLSTPKLSALTTQLSRVDHVQRLRIHSRLPVVLPERVDDALVTWLSTIERPVTWVVHANHANEFDRAVAEALQRIRLPHVTLLNQAVLLRGVNDSVDALADLSEKAYAQGVLPYYLHLLDRVHGTAHFEVNEQDAKALIVGLRARLPGYLVPRLARETEGHDSKDLLA